MASIIDQAVENNRVPDRLIRFQIRRLLRDRLRELYAGDLESRHARFQALLESARKSPIAVDTAAANEQHYEVPTAFYQAVLGKHLKYSSGYWKAGVTDIDQSEADMLALTCERAQLVDGQAVLELGCGWGSLSLWMAAHYPQSTITGVSNSRTQKAHIDAEAKRRGLTNLTIVTADMNVFKPEGQFDRVVSVEMFEHMRNHEELMKRVASWLKPEGKLFVHIFVHKEHAYLFEVRDASDWMSKYFFTGGIMPNDHYLFYFADDLHIETHWRVSGEHYQKTSEAWLSKMDVNRSALMPLFEATYGKEQAVKWWVYWRIFFMACAELWGYRGGDEWFVGHYLFKKS